MSGYTELQITIRPTSAFLTPLVADTLWGHLVWAEVYGGGDISAWLAPGNPQPPIVITDVFPAGWLPAPKMALTGEAIRAFAAGLSADTSPERLVGIAKRAARRALLPQELVQSMLAGGQIEAGFLDALGEACDGRRCPICMALTDCEPGQCPVLSGKREIDAARACRRTLAQIDFRAPVVPSRHVAIDRATSTALEGQLFDYADEWPDGQWRCWMRTTLERGHIERLMAFVGDSGYGKRASVGKGRFEVVSVDEGHSPLPGLQPARGRYMILSSSLAPGPTIDLTGAVYGVRVKRGKLHNSSQYIKKPVAMFTAGSVFVGTPGVHVGALVPAVHSIDPEVVDYGIAYPVAF